LKEDERPAFISDWKSGHSASIFVKSVFAIGENACICAGRIPYKRLNEKASSLKNAWVSVLSADNEKHLHRISFHVLCDIIIYIFNFGVFARMMCLR
jgi:hypothetical protein